MLQFWKTSASHNRRRHRLLSIEVLETRCLLSATPSQLVTEAYGDPDPDDQISEAIPLELGVWVSDFIGVFDTGDIRNVDMYEFTAAAGQTIYFDIESPGSWLTSGLRLFDQAGNELAFDQYGGDPAPGIDNRFDPFIEYTFTVSGTYYIGVSHVANLEYDPVTGEGDSTDIITFTTGTYYLITSVTDVGNYGSDIIGRSGTSWWVAESNGTSAFVNDYYSSWPEANWQHTMSGDFNNDGITDVVSQLLAPDGLRWYVGVSDGDIFFQEYWGKFSSSVTWVDYHIADVNGDGFDDIVGRTTDGAWWVGRSTGTEFINEYWGYWVPNAGWQDVQVADVNADGKHDMIGRTDSGYWYVLVSNGSSFDVESWGFFAPEANWSDVLVGDMDGDGDQDIIGRNYGDWWIARSNRSSFHTSSLGYWDPDQGWSDIMIGDVNNDGQDDVIGRASDGLWWVGLSSSYSIRNELWGYWVPDAGWQDVQIADVDRDGDADIVGRAASGHWWVARSNGTDAFTTELWGYWVPDAGWQDVMVGNSSGATQYISGLAQLDDEREATPFDFFTKH